MNLNDVKKFWDHWGRKDPLWAILTEEEKSHNRWELNDFFKTGINEIDNIIPFAESQGINFTYGKALDFGCGVGRLTQALANYFKKVYGVDIAQSMINLADKYNLHKDNCKYLLNEREDLKIFPDNNFDFIISLITLQHIEPKFSKNYIIEFLRILSKNGLLVFQMPSDPTKSKKYIRRGLLHIIKKLGFYPTYKRFKSFIFRREKDDYYGVMKMYGINKDEMIDFLKENGAKIIVAKQDIRAGPYWSSYLYFVKKSGSTQARTISHKKNAYSVLGFVKSTLKRLSQVRYGLRTKDKVELFIYALLNTIPRTLRKKYDIIGKFYDNILSKMEIFNGTIISVNGIKFNPIDVGSYIILTPGFEPWMFDYLKPKYGDVFIDVGAHIGKYSLQVAEKVGKEGLVIAIEPMPECYEALEENILLNKFNNIIPLNCAAWDKDSTLKLFIGDSTGTNSIKFNMGLGHLDVKARALDNLLEEMKVERVEWIKIDVEGSEYEVLRGLVKTLEEHSPKLIVEIKEPNKEKVLNMMKKLKYIIYPIDEPSKEYYYFIKKECLQ